MAARPKIPALVHHKPRDLARVKVGGRIIYLGKWGSEEAQEAYARIVASVMSGRPLNDPTKPPEAATGCTAYTVGQLASDYIKHAEQRYRKQGRATSEVHIIRTALGFLDAYAKLPAVEFTAADLEAVRQLMIDYRSKCKHRAGKALSRPTINTYVSRIVRAFDRAHILQTIPETVPAALAKLPGLQEDEYDVPEPPEVKPVEDAIVEATTPHMPQVLADMVRVQRLCSMRPGEVCSMRPADLTIEDGIVIYTVPHHKTKKKKKIRTVYIGPKAQAILAPYLAVRGMHEFVFRPDRQPFTKLVERRYSVGVYRTAIARACERAKIEPWSPNRLRHTAGTAIRKQFGIEAASVMLGHSKVSTTEIYAEKNRAKGLELAQLLG